MGASATSACLPIEIGASRSRAEATTEVTAGHCLLCGKPGDEWLSIPADWRRPECLDTYRLRWCNDCSLGGLAERPAPAKVHEFYEVSEYYTHNHATGDDRQSNRNLWDRLRFHLAWRLDRGRDLTPKWFTQRIGDRPLRVCDLGCGNGARTAPLLDAGHAVWGVDPDPAARQIAQSQGLRVCDGTAEDLPPSVAKRRFDVVILGHVLEHCLDPLLTLSNARSLLDEGGRVVIETPNSEAAGGRQAGPTWQWLDAPRHLNFFTERSLRAFCRRAGLEVEAIEFRGYSRQFGLDWLTTEQRIWDLFQARSGEEPGQRASRRLSWRLLLRTMFGPRRRKYDSVRVIARRSPS